jgi:hypothetical protein
MFCPDVEGQPPPDLATQLESILDEVWRDERYAAFDDKLDLWLKQRRPE